MKPQIRNLRPGDRVWAIIEENLERRELVVNFGGDLIRILNGSDRVFRPGQRVLLLVESIGPLQFKLVTGNQIASRPSSLDLTV